MLNKVLAFTNRLKNSKYVRNVASLASGTAFAQTISILAAPFLYRIYSTLDYGLLGLYIAVVGVVSVFSTLQLNNVILIEKEDDTAKDAVWLIRSTNLIFTIFILVIILFTNDLIAEKLNDPSLKSWLYLVPISVFFSAQNDIYRAWANRKGYFNLMVRNTIIISIIVPSLSLVLGIINNSNPSGLFIAYLAGQIVPTFYLSYEISKKDRFLFSDYNLSRNISLFIKHQKFPIYSLPAEFLNRFANQVPTFLLSIYSGPSLVAIFNLSKRMLSLPVDLVSNSISEVFKKKASDDYFANGACNIIFKKTFFMLLILSIVPTIIILFYGKEIFSFIFGEEWYLAGVYSQILIILFMFRFVVRPLSYLFTLTSHQKEDAFWHLILLIGTPLSFWIGFEFFNSDLWAIGLYSICYVLIYVIYLSYSYKYSKG